MESAIIDAILSALACFWAVVRRDVEHAATSNDTNKKSDKNLFFIIIQSINHFRFVCLRHAVQ